MSTLDTFIRFTGSAFGLDRSLRLIQAIVGIILGYPVLLTTLASFIYPTSTSSSATGNPADHATLTLSPMLAVLATHIDLARRWLRIFSLFDCFRSAHKIYTSPSSLSPSKPSHSQPKTSQTQAARAGTGGLPLSSWLDVASHSFIGMYLSLELLTFPDILALPGLTVFSPETGSMLTVECMRLWLFGLLCGAAAEVVRLYFEDSTEQQTSAAALQRYNYRAQRTLVAIILDLHIPLAVGGWHTTSSGAISVAMLVSTILTGMDVWEKCAAAGSR